MLRAERLGEVLSMGGVDVPGLPVHTDREASDEHFRDAGGGAVVDVRAGEVGRIAAVGLPEDVVEIYEGPSVPDPPREVVGVARELTVVEEGIHRVSVVDEGTRVVGGEVMMKRRRVLDHEATVGSRERGSDRGQA